VVTVGAKWTGRIGNVVRRHDLWGLRSCRRPQECAQIADLRLKQIHRLFGSFDCCFAIDDFSITTENRAAAPGWKERAQSAQVLFHTAAP
jgi:hypothetical protein